MSNATKKTKKPIRFLTGKNLSTIIIRADLLDKVCQILDANSVTYEVGGETLILDDYPEVAFIDFSNLKNDPSKIRTLLDGIA